MQSRMLIEVVARMTADERQSFIEEMDKRFPNLVDDLGSYIEFYYTYEINDSLVIKPGVSYALPSTDADSFPNDDVAFYLLDQNVYGIEATFKF